MRVRDLAPASASGEQQGRAARRIDADHGSRKEAAASDLHRGERFGSRQFGRWVEGALGLRQVEAEFATLGGCGAVRRLRVLHPVAMPMVFAGGVIVGTAGM